MLEHMLQQDLQMVHIQWRDFVSVPTDYPITAYVPTKNYATESVPSTNTITAYIVTDIYATVSVPTDYPITAYVTT